MKVYWEVEDGFIGKSRPQSTEIPDEEISACPNLEAAMYLINEYIQADFENNVTFGFERDVVEIKVKKLLGAE